MLELALKARIPIISVKTDDLLNYRQVLSYIADRKVKECPTHSQIGMVGDTLLVTENADHATPETYKALQHFGKQLVLVNVPQSSPLAFEAGTIPTPDALALTVLKGHMSHDLAQKALPILKGLSLKAIGDIVMLTLARGPMSLKELRNTRAMISPNVQGLVSLDTWYEFYSPPADLSAWLTMNVQYFLKPVHQKLTPRGMLLAGPPGTGKTMAAKYVANILDVPLYRLDVATTLNRYVGASEERVMRILQMVEREAPCVLLIDEVEKLFSDKEETGVVTRIMSQLLWWLSEHQSQVFTVMTSNNTTTIPPELFRAGRIDRQFVIHALSGPEAISFAVNVLKATLGANPTLSQVQTLKTVLTAMLGGSVQSIAHVDVAEAVYTQIKSNKWL